MTTSKLLVAAALLGSISVSYADETYRILPLGDSITQAEINRASYRYPLWKKLVDSGIQFDFVGSLKKQQDRYSKGTPPQPDYKGLEFDRDHEGHFGWNINEIIDGRGFDNGSGSGKLEGWVEDYDADIALIHLGTNDAFNRHSNESSVEELEKVIRILREDNPRITILLAKVIPTARKPGDAEAVESLNEAIPEVVENMSTDKSPVILVDHFTGFDAEEHTYDGVHPNAAGEEIMAQRWFEAIESVVDAE
jgi:hypothetical protein